MTSEGSHGASPDSLSPELQGVVFALLDSIELGVLLYDNRRIVHLSNDAMRGLVPAEVWPPIDRTQREVLTALAGRCTDVSGRRLLAQPDRPSEGIIETADDPPRHFLWRRQRLGAWLVDTFQPQSGAREVERQTVDFVSGAAHDLKTPITSIKGYAQLSLRRIVDGDVRLRQNLRGIADQSDRLVRLIDTIVDVARIRLGRFELHRTTFDLGEAIRGAVAVQAAWNERHSFHVTVDPEPLTFRGDATRLRRCVESLIDNAVKFSPNGGNVQVSARVQDNRLLITVEDEGIGISEATRSQILDAGWARPGSDVARPRRMGLSLPLALRVVEAHRGTLRLDNRPEGGARVDIDLPLGAETAD
ncbi:MAG TPA: HAMP domain-containing sensor histidine kinase [Dehalococcoidia bacterium]|nr:HAMP domain-containing sensor histidine kinase [Dehalococcoidia bacterium]